MAINKTKIVLDSDVIIHFIKGDCFTLLFQIFPEYQYLILDVVYDELSKNIQTRNFIDHVLTFMPDKLKQISFSPAGAMMRQYALLLRTLGKGESACMIYCYENQDVLGSSNLKDIQAFCAEHQITYLTTLDFLYYAYIRKLLTKEACDEFIQTVCARGSKLPLIDISRYHCTVML